MFAGAGLVLAITLVFLGAFLYQRARSSSELDRSIAVLPFENLTPDSKDQFLAAGIQNEEADGQQGRPLRRAIVRAALLGVEKRRSQPRAVTQLIRERGASRLTIGLASEATLHGLRPDGLASEATLHGLRPNGLASEAALHGAHPKKVMFSEMSFLIIGK